MRKCLQVGFLALAIVGSIAALAAAPAAAASGFSYKFTSGSEGWEASQGLEDANVPATWASSGGNPSGGAISITDTDPGEFNAFVSPPAIVGNYGANFSGTLSMDMKSSKTWQEEATVVLVGTAGNERVLCLFDESVIPETAYQTAHYTLDGAHTFVADQGTGECSNHPTDLQVYETLSTLQAVVITTEDETASNETTTVDNVTLSGGGPLPTHKLTVLKAGGGSGTVTSSPAGLACGATCAAAFTTGSTVTLTATPVSGSTFAGWSGGGCSGAGACQVSLDADREVTALFDPASSSGSTLPLKPLKCKKGFKKKPVHGKVRCVKLKKKKRHHHH